MNAYMIDQTVATTPIMSRLTRKRNHNIILMLLLILVLMVIWLNMYLTRTLNQNRNLVDCSWPCFGVTCTACHTKGTTRNISVVDIMRYLKIKPIQQGSIGRSFTHYGETDNKEQVCKRPSFDLDHDSVKYAFFPLKALNCTGTKLFYVDRQMFRLNYTVLQGRSLEKCLYFGINRLNDDFQIHSEPFIKQDAPFDMVFKQDFIHVKCYLKENKKRVEADHLEQLAHSKNFTFTQNKNVSNEATLGRNKTTMAEVIGTKTAIVSHADNKNNIKNKSHFDAEGNNHLQKGYHDIKQSKKSITRQLLAEIDKGEDEIINESVEEIEENLYDNYYDPFHGNQLEETADFEQLLVQVHPRSDVFDRISRSLHKRKSQKYMDVLILGLDSMSHLSFQRKLPLTYKYLKHTMKSAILEGYNIVGDATTAALIPILTGHSETELPEVRRNKFDSRDVDIYPMIWKQFQKAGYVTMFAEDEPSIGAFNLRLNGFNNQPTDHYMRPFWQALWESELRRSSPRYCTGYKPNHEYLLDYLKDFYTKYNNVSKFAFVFGSELTHWDNNPGEYMDRDLRNLLHYFDKKSFLDNTLLIVMGDHGARYSRVRKTFQGKMEERLPMMSLRFPKWFQKLFPDLHKNLFSNTDKLTTPFDIHETLSDVLDLSQAQSPINHSSRAFSLLQNIPLNRTCASSHIQMHWCTCLKQIDVDPSDKAVLKSAHSLLHFINDRTKNLRDKCTKLAIKRVLHAQLSIPNEMVLMFQKSKDDDQRVANFSRTISLDHTHIQVTMETTPNNGIYEATIQVNMTASSYTVIDDVSRLNLYGNQPLCIQKSYPDLRKYCYCVSKNSTME